MNKLMRRYGAAWLALSPSVLAAAVCFYGCIAWMVYISFTRSKLLPNYQWAGTLQCKRLMGDERWHVAMGNLLIFGGCLIVFTLLLGGRQALGATMIYVTHDQIEAMTMATRVALMREGRIEQYAAPATLYNRPASRHVAEFVGSPQINILDGELLASERDRKTLTLSAGPAGPTVPLRVGSSVLALPVDRLDRLDQANSAARPVQLGLRPEHLALGDGPLPVLLPDAVVETVEFTGADAMVWAGQALGGTSAGNPARVCVRVAAAAAPALGQHLAVRADPAGLSLFDPASGRRL